MKKDSAIEEIRAVRRKISRRFGHDSKALVAHYMELQGKHADRLVASPSAVHPARLRQHGRIEAEVHDAGPLLVKETPASYDAKPPRKD